MSLLALSDQGPFFDDKVRAFWRLQTLGWLGWLGLRGVSGLATGQPIGFLVPQTISAITGFSLTLILSVFYSQLIDRRPLWMWSLSFILAGLATGLWAFIDAWIAQIQRPTSEVGFTSLFLAAFYIDATSIAAWSALYYAINYFLKLEEQQDRMIRLEAQAASAQLAMLRYQLNPHFLFNTLNSISTLVLLKETERANTMLSRLSSFLRYSLVSDPTETVTLAQEIEALKLYFEIERMRFEDRLRVRFDIDEAAMAGHLPSLLLQPLVENCVKYAVTPQEDGAEIVVSAHISGDRLLISVSDDGPGLTAERSALTPSSGVGLNNIRDRLFQTYGDAQRFEMLSNVPQGVVASIEIPFEPSKARL